MRNRPLLTLQGERENIWKFLSRSVLQRESTNIAVRNVAHFYCLTRAPVPLSLDTESARAQHGCAARLKKKERTEKNNKTRHTKKKGNAIAPLVHFARRVIDREIGWVCASAAKKLCPPLRIRDTRNAPAPSIFDGRWIRAGRRYRSRYRSPAIFPCSRDRTVARRIKRPYFGSRKASRLIMRNLHLQKKRGIKTGVKNANAMT